MTPTDQARAALDAWADDEAFGGRINPAYTRLRDALIAAVRAETLDGAALVLGLQIPVGKMSATYVNAALGQVEAHYQRKSDERLRALRPYLDHYAKCPTSTAGIPKSQCTCGLAAALDATEAER